MFRFVASSLLFCSTPIAVAAPAGADCRLKPKTSWVGPSYEYTIGMRQSMADFDMDSAVVIDAEIGGSLRLSFPEFQDCGIGAPNMAPYTFSEDAELGVPLGAIRPKRDIYIVVETKAPYGKGQCDPVIFASLDDENWVRGSRDVRPSRYSSDWVDASEVVLPVLEDAMLSVRIGVPNNMQCSAKIYLHGR